MPAEVEQIAFADRLPMKDQFTYEIEVDPTTVLRATGIRTSTLATAARTPLIRSPCRP